MHVSILCGDVLGRLLPNRKKRLRGYTGRRVRALFSAVLALLLVGVTGFTPSVLRAAGAVWLSALGCLDLAGRGRCSDDGGQQLRRL